MFGEGTILSNRLISQQLQSGVELGFDYQLTNMDIEAHRRCKKES
jgi:hypothetical protein